MTSITTTTSQFVSPSTRPELGGELGLDLHEIAKSLGTKFADLKVKVDRMIKDNRITAMAYAATVEAGTYVERKIDSYLFDVESARFLVAKTNTKIGDAYTRHLIQCEAALKQVGVDLTKVFVSPTVGIMFLKEVEKKNETIKLLGEDKAALEKQKTWISQKREASVCSKLQKQNAYIRKNGLPIPTYLEEFVPEVNEALVEEIANRKAFEFMTAARNAARKAQAELEEERAARTNIQKDLESLASYAVMKQKEQRMESVSPKWPNIEWRARPELLKSWGVNTAAPGQDGWKQFTVFCRGLHPDLNRYNQGANRSEMRLDLAEKFKSTIIDFFTVDLKIPLVEDFYPGQIDF